MWYRWLGKSWKVEKTFILFMIEGAVNSKYWPSASTHFVQSARYLPHFEPISHFCEELIVRWCRVYGSSILFVNVCSLSHWNHHIWIVENKSHIFLSMEHDHYKVFASIWFLLKWEKQIIFFKHKARHDWSLSNKTKTL